MPNKDKPIWIVVCPRTGARLCHDKRWRKFANFGTYPECVREYRYEQAAINAGLRYRHPNNPNESAKAVALYTGDSMDAAGHVERRAVN